MNIKAIKTAESEIACNRIKSLVRQKSILPNFEPSKELIAKREYIGESAFWDKKGIKSDTFEKTLNK